MEYLQNMLDGSSIPIVTAFLLGLLTALSPCPLATNITAIGFISKDIESRHRIFLNGSLYTLGRIFGYVALSMIVVPILREGASIFQIQSSIAEYGEIFLAPSLILIGLFMLFGSRLNLPKFGFGGDTSKLGGGNSLGALLLGVLFSLAFCPTSGVFYFGMLMPMAASESSIILLPLIFAIATALPVLIVAWILAYSAAGLGRFYQNMQSVQKWMNRVIAIIFIAVGVYYAIIFYL